MRDYMNIEEYITTMTDEEWFDLMVDCFADDMVNAIDYQD